MVHKTIFEDLYFVWFCDEINFEKSKKSPREHQQGDNLKDSYSPEKFIFLFSGHEPIYFIENKEKTLRASYDRGT